MTPDDYRIVRHEKLEWRIIHKESEMELSFIEGLYDQTAKLVNEEKGNAQIAAEMRELATGEDVEWISRAWLYGRCGLLENEYCTYEALKDIYDMMAHMVDPDSADEYAFEEDFLPLIAGACDDAINLVKTSTNDELQELILMLDAYWVSPYDFDEYCEDLDAWHTQASKIEALSRIGARIKELRTEQKLTQDELAKKAGITRANLSNIEAGKYSAGIDTLNKITKALGAEIEISYGE